jgi:hypothetical protein
MAGHALILVFFAGPAGPVYFADVVDSQPNLALECEAGIELLDRCLQSAKKMNCRASAPLRFTN